MRPVRKALAGALLGVLALAGCGQNTPQAAATPSPAASASSSSAFPVTVDAGNGKVTIQSRPERIVSLSPTATETLFAIGAGPQVVAVDDQSNHPPEAPKTSLSGYKPNAEAIAEYRPDLVVVSNDNDGIVGELTKLQVPVLVEPSAGRLEDVYDQITDLGAATGHADEAAKVAQEVRSRIEKAAASVPRDAELTYYHELDTTPYSVTSETFIGRIYGLFGLTNIADKAPDAAGGYPKLSAEFIAEADPDLIFLADTKCCGQSRETLAKRPGWSGLSAVKNDRVVQLDDDIASRWGPRVADLAETVGEAVRQATAER
ncbi:ABC transporter substrate-binding protein [Thermostaphylospora chromogena]|uniref:Iron complex transport system substrate-binding protein n=1 Tax=Thermostaphylospora chromogena TaxID=35622 RepID=A0A1H1G078_9ACTN|nr:ABC transporter substrate-binding protein [Thermostaphylospora chromogena]SDR06459.1 iron complex transport system substrate-binding protein [Thermostaphylospora chromogena]